VSSEDDERLTLPESILVKDLDGGAELSNPRIVGCSKLCRGAMSFFPVWVENIENSENGKTKAFGTNPQSGKVERAHGPDAVVGPNSAALVQAQTTV
jgi:hypothetical protein